ncbi:hypothetical protein WEI85_38600 [Actinomycetes bacterium KLBMP 9797]
MDREEHAGIRLGVRPTYVNPTISPSSSATASRLASRPPRHRWAQCSAARRGVLVASAPGGAKRA